MKRRGNCCPALCTFVRAGTWQGLWHGGAKSGYRRLDGDPLCLKVQEGSLEGVLIATIKASSESTQTSFTDHPYI
nr:MAG: hypothetical protein DIU57_19915 [Pseudomonadota bacterium]